MNPRPPERAAQWIIPGLSLVAVVLILFVFQMVRADSRTPVQRGVDWLASHQHADGSWRGDEVAVLRPGPAMTALVLHTLLPYRSIYSERLGRAVKYLESQTSAEGIVGGQDYPTYATSLTILSYAELSRDVGRLVDSLKRSQLDESEGWSREDAEYGGWAFGGPPQPKPAAHRLDVSTTRFALEALAAAKVPADDPVWERARRFLERCQNPDGGFHFTVLAGQDKNDGRSYGSATADGLRSLRAASGSKERIAAAEAWIQKHFTADKCPGFPVDHPRNWADGLLGYWLAAVRPFVNEAEIARVLGARQRPDGSWQNPVDLMLENEPLLATALAVSALTPGR